MDPFALRAANLLAGDDPHCAAVEVGLGGITFRALRDCVIAVAGFGFSLSVYIWDFPLWSSYYVRGGWTVRLDKLDFGMWAYLAVSGGVQNPDRRLVLPRPTCAVPSADWTAGSCEPETC
jgi:antagonist of KipI